MRLLYKTGAMESLRKWFYKPKRDDHSLLAQFFFADETLNMVAAELDSFDGREDPERCSTLVNQLRHAQEHVLNITGQIMDQLLGSERVARGFRVKFPEDVLQDNLAGQLWFGAECLAAGSSIMNREEESAAMRPLAKALTRSLETVRALLRDHCLRCNQHGATGLHACSEMLHESLKIFDRLFAEFELCYVSAMVPVKTPREFEVQQHICVLFSETLQRARRIGLLTQDQVDDYDPALMFAIPRLAIVSGLLIFSNGPLSIDKSPAEQMSDMFRPFRTLLYKIRELLWTLDRRELYLLEKLLCTNEDIANIRSSVDVSHGDGTLSMNVDGSCYPDISEFVTRFYSDFSYCKDMMMVNQMAGEWGAPSNSSALSSQLDKKIEESTGSLNDGDYLPDNMEIFTPILDGMRRLNQVSPTDDVVHNHFSKSTKETEITMISQAIAENNSSLQESSVDEPKCSTDSQPVGLHSSGDGEHHIRLNVEYVDDNDADEKTKDVEILDPLEESLTLTLTRMESRSSSRSLGSRKSSRNDSSASTASHTNDFMIRNLSSNGLSMFDPLAGSSTSTVNINPMASDNNVLLPDQLLVSNLSDQVSEIADKLSSITYDPDKTVCLMDTSISNHLQDQVYSFSTNDVSNLVSDRESSINFPITRDNVNYSPGRSEKVMSQLANMPSTSHGYLIPNAIGQEPAILTSLSNNNSVIFDEDPLVNPINNPMMMSQQSVNLANMESEMFGDSISVANANLSSLLLTNDEFQNRFMAQGSSGIDILADKLQDETFTNSSSNFDEANFYSVSDVASPAKVNDYPGKNSAGAKARFLIGYESDSNELTPGDSGICTENTSLDRSPDSEVKDLNNTTNSRDCIVVQNINEENTNDRCNVKIESCCNHYMDLNCTLSNENNSNKSLIDSSSANCLHSSFSSNGKGGVTINITDCPPDGTPSAINSLSLNYSENSGSMQKNEAGPSHCIMQSPEFVSRASVNIENSDTSCNHNELSSSEKSVAGDMPDVINNYCDINLCSDNFDESRATPEEDTNVSTTKDSSLLDSNINDNCSVKIDNCDSNVSVLIDSSNDIDANSERVIATNPENIEPICLEADSSRDSNATMVNDEVISESVESNSSVGVLNQRKLKKSSSPKSKKKGGRKSRLWSPGQGMPETRTSEQPSPMRLNLEQLVDQGGGGSCSSQSSVTSSFHSECADDEEIALALQAQEFAYRHRTRAKFRSSEDLIHRLFVCIAGVADQLQTNFASDLRNILKSVFLMNQTPEVEEPEPPEEVPETKEPTEEQSSSTRKNKSGDTIEYEVSESEVLTNGDSFDSIYSAEEVYADNIDNADNSNSDSTASRRSPQNTRILRAGTTEDADSDSNHRRNSQPAQRSPRNSSDSKPPSRRNTINAVITENRRRIRSSTDGSNPDIRTDGDSDAVDRITCDDNDDGTHSLDHAGSTRSSSSDSSLSTANPQPDRNMDVIKDPDERNLASDETVTNFRLNSRASNDSFLIERNSPRSGRNNMNNRDAGGDNASSRDRGIRSQSVCGNSGVERAPEWVPDIAAPDCMRCGSHFTAFRRRHHCRNCGKVFCASCSGNSVPLPRFGQMKPVRVCEECFQSLAKRSCAARQIIPATQAVRHANYTHR